MTTTDLSPVNKHDKAKNLLNSLIAWIVLFHAIFFIVFWYLNPSLARSTNDYLKNMLKVDLPFIAIFMILYGLMGTWALIRLFVTKHFLKKKISPPKPALKILPFLITSMVFLILFYASYLVIFALDHTQKGVMLQFLDFLRIAGDLVLLIMIAAIIQKLLNGIWKHRSTPKWILVSAKVIGMVLFAAFWVLPVIFPPGFVYKGTLPEKPAIFAHRGASMIAPENTLIATQLAADYGAFGFESDLRISRDGVPFMMHDETLLRTTDIREIFSDRQDTLAEDFTLEELKSLNAGWWFLLEDPYGTVQKGVLPQTTLVKFKDQRIPTLEEVLSLIEMNGLVLMYDLRSPMDTHPYYPNLFNRVFERIEASSVQNQVWLILDEKRASEFRTEHPDITRVIGLSSENFTSPEALILQGYQVVNVDKGIHNADIKAYQQAGLKVNIYVVDEPWLFSQFWLNGANSITSNNIHELSKLDKPLFSMPLFIYLIFWSVLGILLVLWLLSGLGNAEKKVLVDQGEVPEKPVIPNTQLSDTSQAELKTENGLVKEMVLDENSEVPESESELTDSEPDLPV